jgi:hypothetical protein
VQPARVVGNSSKKIAGQQKPHSRTYLWQNIYEQFCSLKETRRNNYAFINCKTQNKQSKQIIKRIKLESAAFKKNAHGRNPNLQEQIARKQHPGEITWRLIRAQQSRRRLRKAIPKEQHHEKPRFLHSKQRSLNSHWWKGSDFEERWGCSCPGRKSRLTIGRYDDRS